MTILNYINDLLEQNDLACILNEPSDDVPYEHLIVALKTPEMEKEDLLEISTHPQTFEGISTGGDPSDSYHLINFQFVLPTQMTPATFNQVSSCLHFFNRLLHCPGFELDELSDQVIYRYTWFVKKKGIDSFLLMQVIGNLHLCYQMFGRYIQEIAEGQYTLEDILEKVTALSNRDNQS